MPPIWALGYHQCRWHEYTQDDVEAARAALPRRRVPCDALWLDIDYMDGYRVFTWDTRASPTAPGMLERLREQGFRVITIVDPGVKHDPGYCGLRPGARARRLLPHRGRRHLHRPGLAGQHRLSRLRHARGSGVVGRAQRRPRRVRPGRNLERHERAGDRRASPRTRCASTGPASHERYHNQYALLMAMGTTAGLLEAMPDKRTFILSRAGFAGIQRYAANWMGDNLASWDHLWLSMPMATRLRASRASHSSAPTSAASKATPTPSCSCAGCSTAR